MSQTDMLSDQRSGQKQIPMQNVLVLTFRMTDLLCQLRDLSAALLHDTQLAGTEEDGLAPSRPVQMGLNRHPTRFRAHEGQSPASKILLKRQMQKTERISATFG